ncbi:hypothetical protein BGX27_002143, partial [Mortierella sp. AM989]
MEQGTPPLAPTVATNPSESNESTESNRIDLGENEKRLLDKLLSISRSRYEQLSRETGSVIKAFVEAMDRDMTFILNDYFQTKKELEKMRYDFRKLQDAHSRLQSEGSSQVQNQNQDNIVSQLQGELQMTTSELMRAMEDLESIKSSKVVIENQLQDLERERDGFKEQALIKTTVNGQLAHVLAVRQNDLNEKIKENETLRAILFTRFNLQFPNVSSTTNYTQNSVGAPDVGISRIYEHPSGQPIAMRKGPILGTFENNNHSQLGPQTMSTAKGAPLIRWKQPIQSVPDTIDLTTDQTAPSQ